jgi:uncharacterized Ntn-hydrolase superfamily protein
MNLKGIELHTFTIIGRCEKTGMLGIGMATSSPAVGSRCPFIRPGLGAVSVQAIAWPKLGMLAMNLLGQGHSAQGVLNILKESDPFIESRQIGIIDSDGRIAVMTGKNNFQWAGHIEGKSYIAMGNVLAGEQVVKAIAAAYEKTENEAFEERLMVAIEAGRDAGGQPEGQTSAHLLTYDRQPYPYVDLRVDVHTEPVGELRRIFNWFKPLIPYYSMRSVDPRVPRYKEWLKKQGLREWVAEGKPSK